MPRPITKEDIKRWRKTGGWDSLKSKTCPVLGLYVNMDGAYDLYAYSADRYGHPVWCNFKTLMRRKKIGQPKKRIKQFLREPDFGLEEMALADQIMNGG